MGTRYIKEGYWFIKVPDDYPGKGNKKGWMYEHHYVWWQNTGEVVDTRKDLIHHKDENGLNNDFANLEKKSRGKHTIDHCSSGRTMVGLICTWCGNDFQRECRNVISKIKQGQTNFYCCRSHQVSDQQAKRKCNSVRPE